MSTIVEMFKELLSLLILIEVVMFAIRFLFGGTLIGKLLLIGSRNSKGHFSYRKNVWKRRIQRSKKVIHFIKMVGVKVYSMKNKVEVIDEIENNTEVINGGKIIDFQTAKELKYKWSK